MRLVANDRCLGAKGFLRAGHLDTSLLASHQPFDIPLVFINDIAGLSRICMRCRGMSCRADQRVPVWVRTIVVVVGATAMVIAADAIAKLSTAIV